MTHISFVLALFLGSLTAMAPASASAGDEGLCEELFYFAESMAESKYTGIPISEMMNITKASDDPFITKLAQAIIRDAYALPNYSTRDYQVQQQIEFANEVALHCYRSFQR